MEGKKRFLVLPNDERTEGTFETWLNEDGGTGWGKLDLLDTTKPLPEHAIEIEISAGQGFLVPYICWHAVENLETTLAYSFRLNINSKTSVTQIYISSFYVISKTSLLFLIRFPFL